MMLVEARKLLVAHAARHGGNVIHIGLGHHRRHGGGHVARAKLIFAMLVPQIRIIEFRSDRALQGGHAALVRHQRRRLVVVIAARARKGVIHAGVDVELHPRLASQRLQNALAGLRRTEAVLLGDVQNQPAPQRGRLFQAVLDAHAVVTHRHVRIRAAGGKKSQLAPQAVAQHARAALLFRQGAQRGQRRRNVLDPQLHVEPLVELKGARHVGGAVRQLDAGLLAPEQIGHQHHVALLGQQLRSAAHEAIDAENLLAQHQPRPAAGGRHGQIGAEGPAIVRGDRHLARRYVLSHAYLL
ncbi:hypothetical protein D3C85_1024830 [compost metagenome]